MYRDAPTAPVMPPPSPRPQCARATAGGLVAVVLLAAVILVLPFVVWGFRTYQLAFAATHAIAILGST